MRLLLNYGFGVSDTGSGGGGGGPPTGPAGGDLYGSYPNPTVRSVTDQFQWRGSITPPALTATVNDYSPAGLENCTVIRLSTDTLADYYLGGIDISAFTVPPLNTNVDGIYLMLWNVNVPGATSNIILIALEPASIAANQLLFGFQPFPSFQQYTLEPNESATFKYDIVNQKWRMVATSAGREKLWDVGSGGSGAIRSTGVSPSTASGAASFAGGPANTASGTYSTAVGYNNSSIDTSDCTFGNSNGAQGGGVGCTALGSSNIANGSGSTAVGNGNTAQSSGYGTAVGYSNSADGFYSAAIGYDNTASSSGSVALGQMNTSTGQDSVALGTSCTSSNTGTIAIGASLTASGVRSISMGYTGDASGDGSIKITTNGGTTSGTNCVNFGSGSSVSATDAIAIGRNNTASATKSIVIGVQNSGADAGGGAQTDQVLIGSTNITNATEVSVVGFSNDAGGLNPISYTDTHVHGAHNTIASAAHTVVFGSNNATNNGASSYGSVVVSGFDNKTDTEFIVVSGFNNTGVGGSGFSIQGGHSQVIGDNNQTDGSGATGNNSTLGSLNVISGVDNSTVGVGNTVTGDFNTTLSTSTTITGDDNNRMGLGGAITGDGNNSIGFACVATGRSINVIGTTAINDIDATTVINGPMIFPKSNGVSTAQLRWERLGGCVWMCRLEKINFVTVGAGTTFQIDLPANCYVHVDEVGICINNTASDLDIAGGGTPMDASFGINGNNTKFLASTTMNIAVSALKREVFDTLLSDDGVVTLTFTVDVAATNGAAGTGLTGFAYFKVIVVPVEL